MNNKKLYILELFRECNKDEVFQEYSNKVNVGF